MPSLTEGVMLPMGLSIWHIIIILVVILVQAIPIATILKRAGYSPLLAVLWFVPIVGWIGLWIFANARWPSLTERA